MNASFLCNILFLASCLPASSLAPQKELSDRAAKTHAFDEALFKKMEWRLVGPFRGGRCAAVTGVPSQPDTYYFGATGGGVWKSEDSGLRWKNISDGSFGGSIGAVAVSGWDPNVIYVGGGEKTVRGNVSHGMGMWKSTDAGKSWKQIGLTDSHHISRIRIHPKNPDLVYAAVMGQLYRDSEERGIYRSSDGGKTWKRLLFVNKSTGAVDLCMDPSNPRILYAGMWRVRRTPYSLSSGGEGSGLWKSSDGGEHWQELTRNPGLPEGTVGIVGVTVAPKRPERVWAIIEAEKGGVFRSEDGGKTWSKVNSERKLRQRAWYYSRIYADTKDVDTVYVLNVRFHRSKDGGKTFVAVSTPHSDNHDLWIDPANSLRMIEGNDGGANVSNDGGKTWSRQDNQPTAQFYRVTTDNHFPYRIYAAQQDNSTVRIASRSQGRGIGLRDWEPTAGGESGHIAIHPTDTDIVYGGSYDGYLTRVNHRSKERRSILVWPDNPMGWGAAKLKYRFQWNFPIFFSPTDANRLYAAGNVLFRTLNEGQSWTAISPDLTRNDKSRMEASGGPITKDNTSVEYYGTIFAALESPFDKRVLWCGSDDGLIHVSRNDGKDWKNVTPEAMPEWMQINSIEAHPFAKGGLYVAGTRYKQGDFSPYLYRTTDYGEHWVRIDQGIDRKHFTRVIRADKNRRELLYAGTERGVYISFDDGANWQRFQQNLPIVPITDLAIKNGDLVAATQGRALWVLDDLTVLHNLKPEIVQSELSLFAPRRTYRLAGGGRGKPSALQGKNPPGGVVLNYWLGKKVDEKQDFSLEIFDAKRNSIAKFVAKPKKKDEPKLPGEKGMNRFVWDMRHKGAKTFEGMILWGGSTKGPKAVPGSYRARLTLGESVKTLPFVILADPRSATSQAELEAQFDFLLELRDKLSQTHEAIIEIRSLRGQIDTLKKRLQDKKDGAAILAKVKSVREAMEAIEKALYQTKNKSRQDPLNFPIRLNNKLAALASVVSMGDWRPTRQALAVKAEITAKIDLELAKLEDLLAREIPAINEAIRKAGIPNLQRGLKHEKGLVEAGHVK